MTLAIDPCACVQSNPPGQRCAVLQLLSTEFHFRTSKRPIFRIGISNLRSRMKSITGSELSERNQGSRRNSRDHRASVRTVPRPSERRTHRRPTSRNKDSIEPQAAGSDKGVEREHSKSATKSASENSMVHKSQSKTHHARHGHGHQPQPPPGDGTSELEFRQKSRILEVLNAFKEDVVTVKSSQRNKWQEKLDALQQQRCSSQMSLNPNPGSSMSGFETQEAVDTSTDPKPKRPGSGVLWTKEVKGDDRKSSTASSESETPSGGPNICGIRVKEVCHYSSGILAGIFLWQTVFGILLVQELSTVYRLFYWSITTALVLITVTGFLIRICITPGDVYGFKPGKFILHLATCLILLTFHYMNKAIDLQSQECSDYLKIQNEAEKSQIHLSYQCQADKQPLTPRSARFVLSLIPTVATLVIYTYLHIAKD